MGAHVARSLVVALLTLLLSAASCGDGVLPARLSLGVDPSELQLERGAAATVALRVARADAPGAVSVEPAALPVGVRLDPVTIAAGADVATARVEVGPEAPFGVADVVLAASSGAAVATATLRLHVVAPLPEVAAVTLLDAPGTRSLRQGAGSVTLRLDGAHLDGVESASIAGDHAAIGVASGGRLDVSWTVPHGAPLGPVDLTLRAVDGREVVVGEALTVTPITAGPAGDDDSGRGTPEAPVRTLTRALSLAAAGDEVLLLAGTYAAASGEVWPSYTGDDEPELLTAPNLPAGVRVRGVDRESVTLIGPGVGAAAGTPSSVALAPTADADVRDLTIRGFGVGIVAAQGSVRVADVDVTDVFGSAVAAVDRADVTLERVAIDRGEASPGFGVVAFGGARVTLADSTVERMTYAALVTESATLRVERSSLHGLLGVFANDNATVHLQDSRIEDVSLVGIAANDRATVVLRGSTVRAANVGIDFGGRILRLRDTSVVEHRDVGVRVRDDPAVVDLGTAAEPGGNVLQGSTAYQLQDARAGDRTVVITLSDSVVGAGVPASRLASGPVDEPPLLRIEGAGNKVAFD